jgi:hypothetical protein
MIELKRIPERDFIRSSVHLKNFKAFYAWKLTIINAILEAFTLL